MCGSCVPYGFNFHELWLNVSCQLFVKKQQLIHAQYIWKICICFLGYFCKVYNLLGGLHFRYFRVFLPQWLSRECSPSSSDSWSDCLDRTSSLPPSGPSPHSPHCSSYMTHTHTLMTDGILLWFSRSYFCSFVMYLTELYKEQRNILPAILEVFTLVSLR